ncbi:serpin family protein [Candidatus Halobeggiatoa sp. HSG11]|nr:serpin family protein [Candidatus Halobeggiatoa sp. HSG11]
MTSKRPTRLYAFQIIWLIMMINTVAAEHNKVEMVVNNNNKFALELYEQLKTDNNLFFSPYSISTAMAMTYAGANGDTAKQIAQVLHFSSQKLHEDFMHLHTQINHQQSNLKLKMANTFYGQQGYNFTTDFKEKLKQFYQTELLEADFANDHKQARQKINALVEKQTTIKELIKPGIFNELTRLVLVNAIYFKGQWQTKFTKTISAPFWITAKNSIKVPMMKQKGDFSYTSNNYAQIIELPYMGKVSMIIILPKQNLDKVEKLLRSRLKKWLKSLHSQKIKVYIPKFKINANFELSQTLSTMGMKDAFNNEADFSGIDGTKKLHLSTVIHQAFIEVNEEGTEASAATGAVFATRGITPRFRADHPFIFLIRHNPSNSILFMGRVINPS